MSHNYLMLEVALAKELAVAEAVDRLVGVDSSYCPLYYEAKKVSRRGPKALGKAYRANPVVPRFIFVTASFPRLESILAIQGAVRFVLNEHLQPEVIPGWQMRAFMDSVEAVRLRALRIAEKLAKPEKAVIVRSFAELAAQMKERGQQIDPETGEITNIEMAA
jgi:hypothetical protein